MLQADHDVELHIERFDDIVIENTNNEIERLLELKHRRSGSLSDSSSDLWKTLRIWIDLLDQKVIDLDKVELIIVTTSNASDNSAAQKLRLVKRDPQGAKKILEDVANTSKSTELENIFVSFLKLSDELRLKLIERIKIIDSASNVLDLRNDILRELKRTTKEKYRVALFERLEGWWTEIVLQHLSGNSVSPISSSILDAKIDDLREQFFSDNLPIDYRNLILSFDNKNNAKQKIFVKQLELIMLSEPRIATAIYDYYKAYNQRSRWVSDNLLNFNELEVYRDRLIDEWKRRFDRMNEILGTNPDNSSKINESKKIYDWVDMEAEICIRDRCTEPYVVRGTYHMLADELDVGWHPDFLSELQQLLTLKEEKI